MRDIFQQRVVYMQVILFCIFFAGLVYAKNAVDEITGGFRFVSPGVEGQKRWKIEGDKAKFISLKVIEVVPVRAIVYNGQDPEYCIRTDWARMNKDTKSVWTDAPVEIIKGDSRVTGIGLRWKTKKKRVTILSHVKMTLDVDEAKQWQMVK